MQFLIQRIADASIKGTPLEHPGNLFYHSRNLLAVIYY